MTPEYHEDGCTFKHLVIGDQTVVVVKGSRVFSFCMMISTATDVVKRGWKTPYWRSVIFDVGENVHKRRAVTYCLSVVENMQLNPTALHSLGFSKSTVDDRATRQKAREIRRSFRYVLRDARASFKRASLPLIFLFIHFSLECIFFSLLIFYFRTRSSCERDTSRPFKKEAIRRQRRQ